MFAHMEYTQTANGSSTPGDRGTGAGAASVAVRFFSSAKSRAGHDACHRTSDRQSPTSAGRNRLSPAGISADRTLHQAQVVSNFLDRPPPEEAPCRDRGAVARASLTFETIARRRAARRAAADRAGGATRRCRGTTRRDKLARRTLSHPARRRSSRFHPARPCRYARTESSDQRRRRPGGAVAGDHRRLASTLLESAVALLGALR